VKAHPVKRRRASFRDLVYQAGLLAFVAFVIGGMAWNAADALERQNIASGFGFLDNTAGFDVVQTLVAYDETSTYGRVLLVGILNTLLVAVIGVVLATMLGLLVGIGQISSNWLFARLCRAYVEVMRNVPLLLQLFFWYFAVLRALPGPRESWSFLGGAFLNNRGLYLPRPLAEPGFEVVVLAFAAGMIAAAIHSYRQRVTREQTGRAGAVGRTMVALCLVPPLVAAGVMQFPLSFNWPELSGFDFEGGFTVLPELMALVIALATYTSGYIAEIVRAGIQGVPRGQVEASEALGLTRTQALRLVIVPQALRQIIPPLTSQYLNLTKNSSLAVAIGYPDVVSIADTAINQTGRAVECIAIIMGIYLGLSLFTAGVMNRYNQKVMRHA